jgi:DNA-directed RNA polymerase subunit beta
LVPVLKQKVVRDSRLLVVAEGDGVVEYVDSNEIVVQYELTERREICKF